MTTIDTATAVETPVPPEETGNRFTLREVSERGSSPMPCVYDSYRNRVASFTLKESAEVWVKGLQEGTLTVESLHWIDIDSAVQLIPQELRSKNGEPIIIVPEGADPEERELAVKLRRATPEERYAKLRELVTAQKEASALQRQVEALQDQVRKLRDEQISGDDYRLQDFWQQAMETASTEGYCKEYDRLAEAMGGPSRTVDVDVTITVNIPVTATVTLSGIPRDLLNNGMDYSDLRQYTSFSEVEAAIQDALGNVDVVSEVDWSDIEVDEVEEVG